MKKRAKVKIRRAQRRPAKYCDPGLCDHCMYIGEGDFVCDSHPRSAFVLVISDWEPTEDYLHCMKNKQCGAGGNKK